MMLFGAAIGFWITQKVDGSEPVVLFLAVLAAALAGAAMAAIHAFLVITLRANQIVSGLALTIFAGGLGLSAYVGTELGLADLPATHQFARPRRARPRRPARGRPDRLRPIRTRVRLVGSHAPRGALPRAHSVGAQRPRRRRGPGVGRRHGHQRHPVSIRPRPRRRRLRRSRRRLLQPVDHSGLDVGRHARRRSGLDRDRARDLRVLARRALSRRRVPLRSAVGASVRTPGARSGRHSRSSSTPSRT